MSETLSRAPQKRGAQFHDLADLAADAMLFELDVSPKPGLVDLIDSGAHSDMGYHHFTASIKAIRPSLAEIAREAAGSIPDRSLLERIRPLGRDAELRMFTATGGINTHKGEIFMMTLLLAGSVCRGVGPERSPRGQIDLSALHKAVSAMSRGLVQDELAGVRNKTGPLSHGERVYLRYGASGIRGQAESGFPVLFNTAVPFFRQLIEEGLAEHDASVNTLLLIMSCLEDSTVLHRGGPQALSWMQRRAVALLDRGGIRTEEGREGLYRLNREMIRRGISPGGCADLLAGTVFLYLASKNLYPEPKRRENRIQQRKGACNAERNITPHLSPPA